MNGELLRYIDTISREKKIEPEVILKSIEQAISIAVGHHLGKRVPVKVLIDRKTGVINAEDDSGVIDPSILGRIAAQETKKAIHLSLKGAESDVVYASFAGKVNTLSSGAISRIEGKDAILLIERVEAVLEQKEQIPGESYRIGNHIKCLIIGVKKQDSEIKIMVSRTHPDFIRKLFEIEVPELADKSVIVKGLVREPGFRTKMAVYSDNPKIDAVGACVGVRGVRIKNIVEEVGDEKIDVIKWSAEPELFIAAAMKPAEVQAIETDTNRKRAKVFVSPDQIALSIGKKGQNIRLATRLTHWEIDVVSSEQLPQEDGSKSQVRPEKGLTVPSEASAPKGVADTPGGGKEASGDPLSRPSGTVGDKPKAVEAKAPTAPQEQKKEESAG